MLLVARPGAPSSVRHVKSVGLHGCPHGHKPPPRPKLSAVDQPWCCAQPSQGLSHTVCYPQKSCVSRLNWRSSLLSWRSLLGWRPSLLGHVSVSRCSQHRKLGVPNRSRGWPGPHGCTIHGEKCRLNSTTKTKHKRTYRND